MSAEISVPSNRRLMGRDLEIAHLRAILDLASEHGQALQIVGDPGVGKTALLEVAIDEAKRRRFTVLTARGTEAERHLGFAGLHRVLHPILDRADNLSPKHRQALLGAFGYADYKSPEKLFVSLASLELVADVAEDSPVLIVIDDLPWIDTASREAIAFLGRRIEHEPAVLLTSSRTARLYSGGDLGRRLNLGPLDQTAARNLLRQHSPSLALSAEHRVLAAAAGNPLALLELPRTVEVSGAASFGTPRVLTALTERLEEAFAVRMDGFGSSARKSLLVAALLDSDRISEAEDAVARLTGEEAKRLDLGPANAAGLITSDGETFRFRHPLVRSAVAQAATPSERQAVHRTLAQSLAAHPDRATWHRSLAAEGPDELLADELERGAERALMRGAPDVARDWLERAAEMSVDDRRRAHRLVRAAELAFELGRPETVSELMGHARALPLEPADYARLAGLEGAFDDGIPGDEPSILRLIAAADEARQGGDDEVAVALLLGTAKSCHWGAAEEPLRARVRAATASLSLPDADPRIMVIHSLIDAFDRGDALVERLSHWAEVEITDVALASALALTAFVAGDFDRGLFFASLACDGLRRQGRLALLCQALVLQTFSALYLGRWDITNVASDEALRFAVETSQPVWGACARLGQANLAGLRNDDAQALALAEEVARTATLSNNRALLNGVQLARGFAALGASRPGDAYREFSRMMDPSDVAFQSPQCVWAIDYLAEAAELSGQRVEAAKVVRDLDAVTNHTPARGIVRARTLARALVADTDEAESLFSAARELALTATPWYRGRVDLAYGSWLRRQRRVAESRRPLIAAQAVFDALGAPAWSLRAQQELGATGRRRRQRGPESWALLSAQELQIVRLAAEGFSNREIGEQLYLSHRTVASHLYRAFPKLGVTSRAQLHLALPAG